MYKISVYCRNSIARPSNYYRIYQYVNENKEVKINNGVPKNLYAKSLTTKNKFLKVIIQIILYIHNFIIDTFSLLRDIVIRPQYIVIQREMIPKYTPFILIGLLKINMRNSIIIWDFDDNIQASKEISKRENDFLQKNATTIIVTSNYLKNKIIEKYKNKVILMPTSEKSYKLENEREIYIDKIKSYQNEINLVWVGTPANLNNIDKIIDVLDNTAKKIDKKLILNVVCSIDYCHKCSNLIIKNIKWTREEAVLQMKKAHIGIMPLIEGEIQLGKGGFKLIQYMANALPLISSNYGYNKEIVSEDCGFLCNEKNDWEKAIIYLSSDIKKWETFSINSKKRYDDLFSYESNKKIWDKLLKTKEKK